MSIFKAREFKKAYQELKVGMEKSKVFYLLGAPDSERILDGVEKYSWVNREFRGLLRGGTMERKIICEFKDDQLIGYDGENITASIL